MRVDLLYVPECKITNNFVLWDVCKIRNVIKILKRVIGKRNVFSKRNVIESKKDNHPKFIQDASKAMLPKLCVGLIINQY